MTNRFFKNGDLKDNAIIVALQQAINDYESGAIIECKEVLEEIAEAIELFEENF